MLPGLRVLHLVLGEILNHDPMCPTFEPHHPTILSTYLRIGTCSIMSISMADEDHKDRIEAVEHAEATQMTGDKGEQIVVESAFAGLSRLQTIRTFRRCIGYVLLDAAVL
jgi:predicted ABC-type ATPase